MLALTGVLVVLLGFALRMNPLLVVVAASLATGLAAGMSLHEIVAAFGKAFTTNRYMAIGWLVLPVVGVLERAGLKERAEWLIGRIHAATAGRLLLAYFILRQLSAALGLTSLGGHAQMVRPLVAPMAEAAAAAQFGPLSPGRRRLIRAHAAAADNIALFFGENLFVGFGSVLLIKGVLAQNGVDVEPLRLALWSVPTALLALSVHAVRLAILDRRLAREFASVTSPPCRQ